jgi:hypothetical protein
MGIEPTTRSLGSLCSSIQTRLCKASLSRNVRNASKTVSYYAPFLDTPGRTPNLPLLINCPMVVALYRWLDEACSQPPERRSGASASLRMCNHWLDYATAMCQPAGVERILVAQPRSAAQSHRASGQVSHTLSGKPSELQNYAVQNSLERLTRPLNHHVAMVTVG